MYKFLLILLGAHCIVCQTPACSGPPETPATNCNQYYECVFALWYWDYKLMTCPTGQVFDESTSTCVTSSTCLADTTTTTAAAVTTGTTAAATTTTLAPTTATSAAETTTVDTTTPESTTTESTTAGSTAEETETTSTVPSTTTSQCSSGNLTPAAKCNEYYECVFALWYWDYKLMTCPTGQVFDPSALVCVTSSDCLADSATTTVPSGTTGTAAAADSTTVGSTAEETESTSTVPSTTTSQCSNGNLTPAAKCNEYYECVFALWYWDYKLMTCPTGQVFDPNSLECVTSAECIAATSTDSTTIAG